MAKLSIRDLDLHGRRVLVRVDFNVPLEEKDGHQSITDDTRIRASVPTIEFLRKQGARTILMSHLGRPKGKPVEKYSLRPAGMRLHDLISHPVVFSHETTGPIARKVIESLHPGDVALLENLRFHPEEEANDAAFAESLAKLGDVYVNDAFGAAHRAHASTAGITKFVPQAAMGLLLEKELKYLHEELANPERPFVVILGGSKVSDKIGVIKALMEKADTFLIGGAMANTFFKAQGIQVGASRVEEDKLDLAREIIALAERKGVKFLLPVDALETREIKPGAATRNTPLLSTTAGISEGWLAVDAGRETIGLFKREIAGAGTVLWNGPLGIFEIEDFANGTKSVAEALAASRAENDHRRRRFGDCRDSVWRGGLNDLHFNRWWGLPRITRRQGIAGGRGAG